MTLLETVKLELDTLSEGMLSGILADINKEKRLEKLDWGFPDDAAEKSEEHNWEHFLRAAGAATPDFMADYEKPRDDNYK